MATKLPRVNLSVPDDIYGNLKRISLASNKPVGTLVRDLLIDHKNVFAVKADLVELSKKLPESEKNRLASVMDAAQFTVEGHQLSAEEVLQKMLAVAQGRLNPDQIDMEDYLEFKEWEAREDVA